jgi:8-oxo-dGTP pyrophosphatase MutT (NUDIX family)
MDKDFLTDDNLLWKEQSKKTLMNTRVFDVTETTSVSPEGKTAHFIVAEAPEWVIIVPELIVDDKRNFLMVKQYRHGSRKLSIEFPGGVVDPGETAQKAAERELLEETGYKALELTELAVLYPNPAIMGNTLHVFYAKNLINTKKRDLDDDEYLNFMVKSEDELIKKMGTDPYVHALMCAAFDIYRRKRDTI